MDSEHVREWHIRAAPFIEKIITSMVGRGITVTRENYIKCAYGIARLYSWTEEDELELPRQLQRVHKRPLYVCRMLQNAFKFTAWAEAQGFTDIVLDPHITVLYSKEPVDWSAMRQSMEPVTVSAGAARKVQPLGDGGAVVLRFTSAELKRRHDEMVALGASHDFDEYRPHVTITMSGKMPVGVVPYPGPLVFGPEIFREIDDEKDYVRFNPYHEPAGSDAGGQFASGGGSYGLVAGDAEKFRELKSEWAKVNNELLEHIDDPAGLACQTKLLQLASLVKEMHVLRADPGGPGGIGLPGGPRDVTIVGAGPGGLAASINGAAEGLDTLVVEANVVAGGQAKFSSRIENFPGFPVGVSGERLTQNMFIQAERLGAETKLGIRVTGLTYDASTGMKRVTLSNGEQIDSRTVIIAGGLEFRRVNFPGSEGSGVVVGDGKELAKVGAGGSIVVVGGSNGAAQAALGCAKTAAHVYVLARSPVVDSMSSYQVDALRNNPKITVIESDSIAKLWRDEHGDPEKIETVKGEIIPVKAIGIFAGSVPETKWVPVEVARDKGGRIHTNSNLETALPGVYAIGDMREGAAGRVGVAVGEGQLALRQANNFLIEQQEAAKAKEKEKADKPSKTKPDFIDRLFALDLDNPWFGQTIDGVRPPAKRFPRKKEFRFNPNHEPAGSDAGGQFAVGVGGGGDAPRLTPVQAEAEARKGVIKGSGAAFDAGVRPLDGSSGHPLLISNRAVSAVKSPENSNTTYLPIDLAAMQKTPKNYKHDMALFRANNFYPGMKPKEVSGSDDSAARAIVDRAKDNLRFLYDGVPKEIRERSKLWYVGSRRLVDRRAAQYGLPDASVAAVYASLSPQKPWYENVYLGDRVMEIYSTKQSHKWDDKMTAVADVIWKTGKGKDNATLISDVRGKSLGELVRPDDKAMWIRTYDEAHSSRAYHIITPEGEYAELEKSPITGKENRAAWGAVSQITDAVMAVESQGDRSIISYAMGDKHKVRNFYNNILDPFSGNGDVTIDTHAVGAAWLAPHSGGAVPVLHSLHSTPLAAKKPAGYEGASGSSVTGVQGTYGLYAQAYRELAKELGIQPRELQSITWEAQRGLFNEDWRSNEHSAGIANIWQQFSSGKLSLADTRAQVVAYAGGFKNPTWVGKNYEVRFNPNHEPGGSPTGGQFGSGGGAPKSVQYHWHGDVSSDFSKRISTALKEAPPSLWARINPVPIHAFDNNATFAKTAQSALGAPAADVRVLARDSNLGITYFPPGGRPGSVSLFVKNIAVSGVSEKEVLYHELMHVTDQQLGRPSRSKEFNDAYNKDMRTLKEYVNSLPPQQRADFLKYIEAMSPGALSSPSEAWAQAGMVQIIPSGELSSNMASLFEDVFPNVRNAVAATLTKEGIIAAPAPSAPSAPVGGGGGFE